MLAQLQVGSLSSLVEFGGFDMQAGSMSSLVGFAPSDDFGMLSDTALNGIDLWNTATADTDLSLQLVDDNTQQ